MNNSEKSLEYRLQYIEDIEAIRNLKYMYSWHLDHKEWDKFADLMAEDMRFVGTGLEHPKAAFIDMVKFRLDPLITCHHLHQHLIERTSETTATGTWSLRDDMVNPASNARFLGRAYYFEDYVKRDGEWKFKTVRIEYVNSDGQSYMAGNDTSLLGLIIPI